MRHSSLQLLYDDDCSSSLHGRKTFRNLESPACLSFGHLLNSGLLIVCPMSLSHRKPSVGAVDFDELRPAAPRSSHARQPSHGATGGGSDTGANGIGAAGSRMAASDNGGPHSFMSRMSLARRSSVAKYAQLRDRYSANPPAVVSLAQHHGNKTVAVVLGVVIVFVWIVKLL